MKRYIYIILGIVVVAILAIVVLIIWKNASSTVVTTTTGTTGSLPAAGTQSNPTTGTSGATGTTTGAGTGAAMTSVGAASFGIVDGDPTFNYFVDAQNDIIAVKTDGTVEEITNGQSLSLSASSTTNIISADFSYDGKKILLLSGDENDPAASVFDVASRKWTVLPSGLVGAKWSPSSYQVTYLASGKTGTTIATFDVSNPQRAPVALTTVNDQDLTLSWLSKTQLVLADKPSANVQSSVLIWNTQTKTLSPVIIGATGLESLWTGATTSTKAFGLVFAQSVSGSGYALQFDDTAGNVLETLNFLTLPSKCLFNNEVLMATTTASATTTKSLPYPALYCGVPRNPGALTAAHLPDDYDQLSLFTSDDIYKVNVLTAQVSTLWNDQNENVDVSDVRFFNNNLFFINRYDQKVYALMLQSAAQ